MQTTLAQIPEDTLVFKNTRLTGALIEANGRPFDPETVAAYQAEMVERHPPSLWYKCRNVIQSFMRYLAVISLLIAGTALCAVVLTGLSVIISSFSPAGVGSADFGWCLLSLQVFLVALLAFCILGFTASCQILVRGPAKWHTVELESYLTSGKKIPPEAAAMRQQIADRFPGAVFTVEELRQGVFDLDPFLVVSDLETGEEYYIYQWDEPLFAG